MRKYTNAEICEMMDNDMFKDGDKIYVVPVSIELEQRNDKFNKENGLYNSESYFVWDDASGLLVSRNIRQQYLWIPEQYTKWTINERCMTNEDIND